MSFKNSTALLTVGFAALTAAPALADISADDIWTSYQAIAQTVGGELTATATRDGNKVLYTDAKLHFLIPDGKGSLDILYPTLSYTNHADGTVSMDMAGTHSYKFVITGPDKKSDQISANIISTYDNAEVIASGNPDDITFSYAVDSFAFALQNLDLGASGGNSNVELSLTGTGSAAQGSSRWTQGDLITLAGQSVISGFDYSMHSKDEDGAVSTTSATYGEMVSKSTITLPTGGMSIMNLAAALHDGLSIKATGTYGSSTTQESVVMDGEQVSSQTITTGSSTSAFAANAEAIQLTAEGSDIGMDVLINAGLSMALKTDIDQVAGDFRMPVSASGEPQDFTLALGLKGLDLGDEIWSMFDPSEVLQRDPATLAIGLTGQATLLQDLLNFTEMKELAEGNLPIELNTLAIKEFLISAVGASLSGTGNFAFNNDDLTSYDGMPAPSGSADLQITGANALIDRLVEMGLVEESDAMGARMMMGMFTVAGDGDDTLSSKLEITEDGQISANGQRLK
ncbi:DUF2125 domain-containing protein [Parasedimentitalea psychrophila]|uniref:DUF2125 domain-containing protein n=1 Tax=Parasedimentitalea psychrophila TaxID=2997337 RepID=A0A9Y2P4H3_9RHOB|nr:DUF2125 domain-containing protein [Parasedimentitalea psychrophila]WIY26972.1 DUF2125 domain-containing protein [Parasedimentitalea psychrophila]